ncbi:MAG: hypothetical protein HDT30_01345 [Clostridiales bacterium]|nr:hypothetical protein [Clostridiales bacterium]
MIDNNMSLYKNNDIRMQEAIEQLNCHMHNKTHFKPYVFSIHNKETITEDFSTKNERLSYYRDCNFENCNFFEAGFAGSVFINCNFVDCKFDFSKFPSCDFRECNFFYNQSEMVEIKSLDLNRSVFNGCTWIKTFFNSANMEEVIFNNGNFIDCKWRSVSVENAIIRKSLLKNMRFASQNFDFMTIIDIQSENVVFPFPAMPFIINGLTYIYNTKDNIRFTSYKNGKQGRINRKDYLQLIKEFEIYYVNTENYFPLANILIAQKRLEDALISVVRGIGHSIRHRNFRMILNFCKLLKDNFLFTIQHRKKLYYIILNEISKEKLSSIDYEIFSLYIGKIKEILIGTTNNTYVIIDMKTNIESSETQKIALIIHEIEKNIEFYLSNKEEHHIELRHNSDENILIQIASDPERLVIFLSAFLQCLGFVGAAIKKLTDKSKEMEFQLKNNSSSSSAIGCNNHISSVNENKTTNYILKQNNINITEVHYHIYGTEKLENDIQNMHLSLKDKTNDK